MAHFEDILVPYGAVTAISKELQCSKETVRYALMGVTKSDKAKQIRQLAIDKYRGRICEPK